MAYRIVFTENAIDDLDELDARRRATVRDAIGGHLMHEPTKESKSRIKRLREFRHPRLRVGDIRAFYDVGEADVVVLAIMPKEKTSNGSSNTAKNNQSAAVQGQGEPLGVH